MCHAMVRAILAIVLMMLGFVSPINPTTLAHLNAQHSVVERSGHHLHHHNSDSLHHPLKLNHHSNSSSSNLLVISCHPIPELSQLVKIPGMRSIMYIITHNNESDRIAQTYIDCYNASDWMFIARSPTTVYFESSMYKDVFPFLKSQWQDFDYVITATYKTLTRQLMPKILPYQSFQNIVDLLKMTKSKVSQSPSALLPSSAASTSSSLSSSSPSLMSYDVIPFLRQNESMFNISIKYHKQGFHDAWISLLSRLGYNHSTIMTYSDVKGFYRNVFIIKPQILQQVCDFMTKAIELTEKTPHLQELMKKDAHYVMGKIEVSKKIFGTRYYQLYPFVFERLPIFFLNSIHARICMDDRGPCKYNYKG